MPDLRQGPILIPAGLLLLKSRIHLRVEAKEPLREELRVLTESPLSMLGKRY